VGTASTVRVERAPSPAAFDFGKESSEAGGDVEKERRFSARPDANPNSPTQEPQNRQGLRVCV